MVELPEIVDAMAVIGMIVSPDDGADVAQASVQQLFAEVRAGVDEDTGVALADEDGDAAAAVFRLVRVAQAPVVADARNAGRRATAENAEAHQAALLNSVRKLA